MVTNVTSLVMRPGRATFLPYCLFLPWESVTICHGRLVTDFCFFTYFSGKKNKSSKTDLLGEKPRLSKYYIFAQYKMPKQSNTIHEPAEVLSFFLHIYI